MIKKRFRCDAPFGLVLIYFYKYYATLLLFIISEISYNSLKINYLHYK